MAAPIRTTTGGLLCVFMTLLLCNYETVRGAPTVKENRLLTEGICSIRSILENRYLHNSDGAQKGLIDTTLELLKMATGMIQYDKILGELESDSIHNTTDVLTSRLMINSVMNHFCSWVSSALNETLNCSDHKSIIAFVTQMALLESVEETCKTIKTYAETHQNYNGVNHCKWMYCNFNPECNPGSTTGAMFASLQRFVPSFCSILWTTHTCSQCHSEGYLTAAQSTN